MLYPLVRRSRCVGGACTEYAIDAYALQTQVQGYSSIWIEDNKYQCIFGIYISIFRFAFIFMLILFFYFYFLLPLPSDMAPTYALLTR
jgi:hypothetical protein